MLAGCSVCRYKPRQAGEPERRLTVMSIELDDAYRPTDKEPFMSERQMEYFRLKLLAWKDDILRES